MQRSEEPARQVHERCSRRRRVSVPRHDLDNVEDKSESEPLVVLGQPGVAPVVVVFHEMSLEGRYRFVGCHAGDLWRAAGGHRSGHGIHGKWG